MSPLCQNVQGRAPVPEACAQSRQTPCAKNRQNALFFEPLGLALSEREIHQVNELRPSQHHPSRLVFQRRNRGQWLETSREDPAPAITYRTALACRGLPTGCATARAFRPIVLPDSGSHYASALLSLARLAVNRRACAIDGFYGLARRARLTANHADRDRYVQLVQLVHGVILRRLRAQTPRCVYAVTCAVFDASRSLPSDESRSSNCGIASAARWCKNSFMDWRRFLKAGQPATTIPLPAPHRGRTPSAMWCSFGN